jgi:flagellar protein FliT
MAKNEDVQVAGRSDAPSPNLIRQYEDIARASHCMLEAALHSDWERVEQIESQCREMIERLKQVSRRGALSEPEERRRIELLREILRDDARMRLQAEPWLRNMEEYLSPPRRPPKNNR